MNRLLLSFLFLCAAVSVSAQQYDYVRVSADSMLTDTAAYFITFKPSKYRNIRVQRCETIDIDSVRMFVDDKTGYPTLDTLSLVTDTFRVRTIGGYHYLLHVPTGKYICQMDWRVAEDKANALQDYFHFSTTPLPSGRLSIEKTQNGMELRLGQKYFRHHKSLARYEMRSKTHADSKPVEMYVARRIPTLVLSEGEALPAHEFSGSIRLCMTLVSGCYNTIILPFEVKNPQQYFGSGVSVYEPVSATDGSLSFKRMAAGATLRPHTPYLLSGQITGGPYTFHKAQVSYKPADTPLRLMLGGISIQGTYQPQDMSGTERYALYRTAFYSCRQASGLRIAPYHWYVEASGATRRPVIRIVR